MPASEKECCRENDPVRGLACARGEADPRDLRTSVGCDGFPEPVSPEPVAVPALPASGASEIEFASGVRLRIVSTVDPMAGRGRMRCGRSILAFRVGCCIRARRRSAAVPWKTALAEIGSPAPRVRFLT
jgi:hypothetical protein